MKRVVQASFCLVLAALILTVAFWPKHPEADLPTQTDTKETIRIWYGDESFGDYINSAAVAFGETRNIRVLPTYIGDQEYLDRIYEATMKEGQGPDLFLLNHELLEKAYLSGIAAPIENEKYGVNETKYPAAAVHAVTYHGKQVAYPLSYDSCVLAYNDTYLELWAEQQARNGQESSAGGEDDGEYEELDELPETTDPIVDYDEETIAIRKEQFLQKAVPQTLDDILHFADTFDPPEGVEGIFSFDISNFEYSSHFVGGSICLGTETGDDRTQIDIYNEKTVRALEAYGSIKQFFYIEEEHAKYESVFQDFLEGRLVFTIVSKEAADILEKAHADGTFPYEYGFVTLPDPVEGQEARPLLETKTVAVNVYTKNEKAACEFADFLTVGYAGELYDRSGKLPAAYGATKEGSPLQVFFNEYEKSVPLPKIMECSNYWLQLENLFSGVWKGKDAGELLQEMDAQVRAQISQ